MPTEDWSIEEVEATVADYFDMLGDELRGRDYNKSIHRRRLKALLNRRSDGAIERKHQNISAVLLELDFPYISGYKPLRNYQNILFEIVSNRMDGSQDIVDLVRTQVAEPAVVPRIENILVTQVDPPTIDADVRRDRRTQIRERSPGRRKVDYLAMEAHNRSLGSAGEDFVVRFEVARLTHAGKDRLAGRVERVSETRGDGLGFDVLSFEVSGKERFIEVKTTAYGSLTPFYVTKGEVEKSRAENDRYHLYRAFDFRRQPRLFCKPGFLENSFNLNPSQFVATIR